MKDGYTSYLPPSFLACLLAWHCLQLHILFPKHRLINYPLPHSSIPNSLPSAWLFLLIDTHPLWLYLSYFKLKSNFTVALSSFLSSRIYSLFLTSSSPPFHVYPNPFPGILIPHPDILLRPHWVREKIRHSWGKGVSETTEDGGNEREKEDQEIKKEESERDDNYRDWNVWCGMKRRRGGRGGTRVI